MASRRPWWAQVLIQRVETREKKKNEGQVQNLLHKIVVKYVANGGKWDIRFHSLCYYYTAVHVILVTRTGRQPAVDVGGAREMKSACEWPH